MQAKKVLNPRKKIYASQLVKILNPSHLRLFKMSFIN
jgi:hypothetical protein